MKSIVKKIDVENFLSHFKDVADYDYDGKKYYFVFEDVTRNGDWTLMFYDTEDQWTIHGKGLDYCDLSEKEFVKEELVNFLYKNRKYVNKEIKKKNKVLV